MYPSVWYRFYKAPFNGDEPNYFDLQNQHWCVELEQKFPEIEMEVNNFIQQQSFQFKNYRFHLSDGKPQWQTFPLMSWGYIHSKNRFLLPKTWAIFEKIRGLSSISISRLVAGASIPGHHGDTNAVYRCHYGIQIPGGQPHCVFVVENEERAWKQGKILAFCDARFHYAKNETLQDRYVILFDVVREPFIANYYSICSKIIATHVIHALDAKFGFYENAPLRLLKFLVFTISIPTQLFLRLQHAVKRS